MLCLNTSLLLDFGFKLATIILGGVNLFYAITFFNKKNIKEDRDKEKERKISLFKTLVLDHTLESFYEFFDSLQKELIQLKETNNELPKKQIVANNLDDQFINHRIDFLDMLLAIDESLYKRLQVIVDELQKRFVDSIFDEGINLSNASKFNTLISDPLSKAKTDMIHQLYVYRG